MNDGRKAVDQDAGNRPMFYLLDEKKNPVPLPQGQFPSELDLANGVIKQEEIGKWFLSTVFLFLNHPPEADPPVLFETLVFRGGNPSEVDGRRYCTYQEALEGHKELVAKYKKLGKSSK